LVPFFLSCSFGKALEAMSVCCADAMAIKVGSDAKPFIVQPLVEESPVTTEFLTTMSGQLQTVQQVIDDVTTKITKLQDQINSRLGHVAHATSSKSVELPTDIDSFKLVQGNGILEPVSEPSPESDMEDPTVDEGAEAMKEQDAEVTEEQEEDAHLADLRAQFQRCDFSSNGYVSGQELVALAFTHGEQLQLGSVLKLCTYLAANARMSVRPTFLDTVTDEQLKKELDLNGFLFLRGDPSLFHGAPQDIVEAAEGLNRALDEENRIYKFENDKDRVRRQARVNLARTVMDVGIVLVISVNALIIGVSADNNPDNPLWEVLELVFFTIYLLEALVKLLIFDGRNYFVGPDYSWNIFDFGCLLISAIELSVSYIGRALDGGNGDRSQLALLKVLRLARLARLVRVMRFKAFKELKLMALGLFSGLKALFWALVLLLSFVFTMSIVMQSWLSEADPPIKEFSSVSASMFTLFRCFTDACETYDGDPIPEQLYVRYGEIFKYFYILITMLVTVGLFNLIMAVFIDNVTKSQVQRKQKELGESAEMTEAALKMVLAKFINEPRAGDNSKFMLKRISDDAMKKLASLTDAGRSRSQMEQKRIANEAFKVLEECHINITREVFQAWLKDPEFVRVLEEAEVDISNKFELFNILDVDSGGELSVEELLNGLMGLRGDVSKGDVVSILLRVRDILQRVERMEQKTVES